MSKKQLNLSPVKIKPRNDNQKRFIEYLNHKNILLVEGGPGCGKTFLSVATGCQWLASEKISKVIFAQTTKHISKNMGYTGGNYREKCLDYFHQHVEYFEDILSPIIFKKLWEEKTIELTATELLRGRNFENALIVLDEAQLCSKYDMLTFISRMAKDSKVIIAGDRFQCEVPEASFFAKMIDNLVDEDVSTVVFTEEDSCRHNSMVRVYNKLIKI